MAVFKIIKFMHGQTKTGMRNCIDYTKKMEEEKEAAEEKAEKEEELEERIEKRDDKEDKQEQIKEQISDSTSNMVELDKVMGDVQKEVKKIMDEMKLTEEDIKGAAVDTLQ